MKTPTGHNGGNDCVDIARNSYKKCIARQDKSVRLLMLQENLCFEK